MLGPSQPVIFFRHRLQRQTSTRRSSWDNSVSTRQSRLASGSSDSGSSYHRGSSYGSTATQRSSRDNYDLSARALAEMATPGTSAGEGAGEGLGAGAGTGAGAGGNERSGTSAGRADRAATATRVAAGKEEEGGIGKEDSRSSRASRASSRLSAEATNMGVRCAFSSSLLQSSAAAAAAATAADGEHGEHGEHTAATERDVRTLMPAAVVGSLRRSAMILSGLSVAFAFYDWVEWQVCLPGLY